MKLKQVSPFFSVRMIGLSILIVFSLAACNNGRLSEESMEATLAAAVAALQTTYEAEVPDSHPPTVTLAPTETPLSTETPLPTETPEPTATETLVQAQSGAWVYTAPEVTATPSIGISLSSTSLSRGESFTVSLYGFTAYADIDLWLYAVDGDNKTIYDGVTDSTGAYSVTLAVPTTATEGENWAVYAYTTELAVVESATSAAITIASDSSDAVVYVSSTSVTGGETFTVTATGFPADSDVDFKLYNAAGTSAVYVDGYTDSTGACAVTMIMPISAVSGESWSVVVYTTELMIQTSAYSSTITSTAAAATPTPTATVEPTAEPTVEPTAVPTETDADEVPTEEPTAAPTKTEAEEELATPEPTPIETTEASDD